MAKKEKGYDEVQDQEVEVDSNKAEKKAEKKAKKDLKKKQLLALIAFVTENTEDPELIAAAKNLTPGQRIARVGMKEVITDLFENVGQTVGEDQIWTDHRLGRKEMRSITNNLIKKEKPENRKWISFDSENGVYELQGIGHGAPNGWTGYVPASLEDVEVL